MNSQGQQVVLPSLDKLIKPGQVQNLACLNDEDKERYYRGILEQYRKMQANPDKNHPEYQAAYRTLAEVSTRLQRMMQRYKQERGQSALQIPPQAMNSGQQNRPAVVQGGQNFRPTTQVATGDMYSDAVKAQARALDVALPPQMWSSSPEERQAYIQNEKRKYATLAQTVESRKKALVDLTQMATIRRDQGKGFTEEEKTTLQSRSQQYNAAINAAQNNLANFMRVQQHYKQQLSQNTSQGPYADSRPGPIPQPTSQAHIDPVSQSSNVQQIPAAHTLPVNTALDAERKDSQPETSSLSPSGVIPQGQTTMNQHVSQSSTTQLPPTSQSVQPASSIGGPGIPPSQQQNHSPQPTSAQLPTSQGPHPLSHKAAMAQAARSYSQPNVNQSTPQLTTHGHPSLSREPTKPTVYPTSKQISVAPLVPVSMGPSRPTLSGGPSTGAMGSMGQPSIQKHPGYVLEGEGERVLSKKKLEELVRQVTGGADGEGAESLDPDVEETLLDVADEFVDNVITAACRLAKIRQGTTLELRDLQLILERNYNIRVPGYASDELRTVKKIQPTPAWSAKISAINAAKLTGGKSDP
ncbi:Transcription initiation factor TFIID subunit 12 [Lambiella insularis]|nr:Transcription initiation factor TFIID subunit 12 [Lambiella insularis]